MAYRRIFVFILIMFSLMGCAGAPVETAATPMPTRTEPTPLSATDSPRPKTATPQPSLTPGLAGYEFPDSIDPTKRYLFSLHGKIIEDQGILAISPEYGEYRYQEILETFSGYGFVVISEQRPKNADGVAYARRVASQVTTLLEAGVPAENITVVGASKGGYIAIYVSHFLENEELNFVIMGVCYPDEVELIKQAGAFLFGNVLSIYDSSDEYAGSCQELFSLSKGPSSYDEIVLEIGTGHGILYQPLDEWVLPAVQWATNSVPTP